MLVFMVLARYSRGAALGRLFPREMHGKAGDSRPPGQHRVQSRNLLLNFKIDCNSRGRMFNKCL